MSLKPQFQTHELSNLPEPLPAYNAWDSDTPLREGVQHHGGAWAQEQLSAYGALTGGELMALGQLANEHRPRLRSVDRYGRRLDQVEFHPAYHELMRQAMAHEVHAFSWRHEATPGAHVVRAALMYLGHQPEAGSSCPLTMTHAAVPALRTTPALPPHWLSGVTAPDYDPGDHPAQQKRALTLGMGMTEKQGGSDVRSNSTRAVRQADGSHELVGHKFFFSAPMSDGHLVLAQADEGLSCFLVPRRLDDGGLNAVHIQRLKDKLGDWANASAEVEFRGATGHLVGPAGRGVATILQMVSLTRLDCMLGSAALMRQAWVQAHHHTCQRRTFGRLLIDHPLMRNLLADLALESEAAIALAMRVARAVDAAPRDPAEAAFARLTTAIGKFWICKRTPAAVNEAQECLGGVGYVEENILPRLYRQAPLNAIWEGSSNVQCLDVLRTLQKDPLARDALNAELQTASGQHPDCDAHLRRLWSAIQNQSDNAELHCRALVEDLALALQASALRQRAPTVVADAFCEARLSPDRHLGHGTLKSSSAVDSLIRRAALG